MNLPDYFKRVDTPFNRLLRSLILSKRKPILTNRKAAHFFTHPHVINRYCWLIAE